MRVLGVRIQGKLQTVTCLLARGGSCTSVQKQIASHYGYFLSVDAEALGDPVRQPYTVSGSRVEGKLQTVTCLPGQSMRRL